LLSIEPAEIIINAVNGLNENHGKCGKVGVLIDYENSRACDENYLTASDSQTMK
jgi:hypothetical protein